MTYEGLSGTILNLSKQQTYGPLKAWQSWVLINIEDVHPVNKLEYMLTGGFYNYFT